MISSFSNCATMLNATIFADLWAEIKKRLDVTYNFLTCELSHTPEPPQIQWLPKNRVFLGVSLAKKPSREWPASCSRCEEQQVDARLEDVVWIRLGTKMVCLVKRELQSSGNISPPGFVGTCRPCLQASAKRLRARQWAGALSNSDEERHWLNSWAANELCPMTWHQSESLWSVRPRKRRCVFHSFQIGAPAATTQSFWTQYKWPVLAICWDSQCGWRKYGKNGSLI